MARRGLTTALYFALFTCTYAKIGYFWHVTDFHYDPLYSTQGDAKKHCRNLKERGFESYRSLPLDRFGDYSCDSPLELIDSAARHMRTRHLDNVEFVLWTGDIVSAHYEGMSEIYQGIRNMTEVLRGAFSSHFVFPALGDCDPPPSSELAALWMNWLPLEALQTFEQGGYYTIEQKQSKLRIVVLNTNLFSARAANSTMARAQWQWLETTLDKATSNMEMVYMVGHVAPGTDAGAASYSAGANAAYLATVRRFARVIAGQFFGHMHADTFRVFYNNDYPVSWAFLAPSLSPHLDPTGSSNPGLRLYKFDTNTGRVLDYTQYFVDLSIREEALQWTTEYNLTQYYGLHDISALSLHYLVEKLKFGSASDTTLNKYLRTYYVRHETPSCGSACVQEHYCAITCLEQFSHRRCLEAAASALTTVGQSAALPTSCVSNSTLLLILLIAIELFSCRYSLIDYLPDWIKKG